MSSKICMNECCRTKSSPEWKKGWTLKSGESATLCYSCGSYYENFMFCETFHREETGWRECRLCGKRIHCGCIASKVLHQYLDFGGVACSSCPKRLDPKSIISAVQAPSCEIPNGAASEIIPLMPKYEKPNLVHMPNRMDLKESMQLFTSQNDEAHTYLAHTSRDKITLGEVNAFFPNLPQLSSGLSMFIKPADHNRQKDGVKDAYEPLPSLISPNFLINNFLNTAGSKLPLRDAVVEGTIQNNGSSFQQEQKSNHISPKPIKAASNLSPVVEGTMQNNHISPKPINAGSNSSAVVEGTMQNKASSCQQEQKSNHISPKPSEAGSSLGPELNKNTEAQARVARPPADGKGRSQLLPRYWPRITDEELQQLSGELKSAIVPLFEKILSASDAGRIGRLVLPKACAETYFPAINQSDGLPIRVQDVKGKEWTFQFRFWPNNNSRMYVLEGITPCIQNLQLEAGDTVTFSRIDPAGKLLIGFRKSTNNADFQDPQAPVLPNGVSSGEAPFPVVDDNMVQNGHRTAEDSSLQQRTLTQEKKKVRNIGSKNKRLFMNSDDALELRLSWEEAQYLLRPPTAAKPTIVKIDDYEFEEYDEPPIFGKISVFTDHPSGDKAQWAQCDNCKKWRKLPVNILLPARWTCSDNIWDADRCSCSAPDETIPWDLDTFNKTSRDFKRRRIAEKKTSEEDGRSPSGLDALANAAVLGDNGSLAEPSTTKHPRHRAGCTCIVCIQPPSGRKGKHPSTCKCNVCNSNAKRRFKKTKQSHGEAEKDRDDVAQVEAAGGGRVSLKMNHHSEGETRSQNGGGDHLMGIPECSKGHLDLNCKPRRDDEHEHEQPRPDPAIGFACFKQNGFETLKKCLVSNDLPLADEGRATAD